MQAAHEESGEGLRTVTFAGGKAEYDDVLLKLSFFIDFKKEVKACLQAVDGGQFAQSLRHVHGAAYISVAIMEAATINASGHTSR